MLVFRAWSFELLRRAEPANNESGGTSEVASRHTAYPAKTSTLSSTGRPPPGSTRTHFHRLVLKGQPRAADPSVCPHTISTPRDWHASYAMA